MKFLRKLLLPLLSILLVTGNQALGNHFNRYLRVSSGIKNSTKTDVRVREWSKQGGAQGAVRRSVEESAKFANRVREVQSKIGKNSIKLPPGENPNVIYRYDLRGAPHKGVPTPHVQREIRNIDPKGKVYWNKDRQWIQPMGEKDLKKIEEYLNSIKK